MNQRECPEALASAASGLAPICNQTSKLEYCSLLINRISMRQILGPGSHILLSSSYYRAILTSFLMLDDEIRTELCGVGLAGKYPFKRTDIKTHSGREKIKYNIPKRTIVQYQYIWLDYY